MRNKDGLDIENPLRVPETHFGKPFHSLISSNDLRERHKGGKGTALSFLLYCAYSLTNTGVNEHESI